MYPLRTNVQHLCRLFSTHTPAESLLACKNTSRPPEKLLQACLVCYRHHMMWQMCVFTRTSSCFCCFPPVSPRLCLFIKWGKAVLGWKCLCTFSLCCVERVHVYLGHFTDFVCNCTWCVFSLNTKLFFLHFFYTSIVKCWFPLLLAASSSRGKHADLMHILLKRPVQLQ